MNDNDAMFRKQHLNHIRSGGVERSLDKLFPKATEPKPKRYPFCMKNKQSISACKTCGEPRYLFREMMKGLCRKCYKLERDYDNKDLAKLARARIDLGKAIRHVRTKQANTQADEIL